MDREAVWVLCLGICALLTVGALSSVVFAGGGLLAIGVTGVAIWCLIKVLNTLGY